MIIKETAIKHFLTHPITEENKKILRDLVAPKNHHHFVPIWLPFKILLHLNEEEDFPVFAHYLRILDIELQPYSEDWLQGLRQFFNLSLTEHQRNKRIPFSTGLRIPFEAACFELAKIHLIMAVAASGNKKLLFSLMEEGFFHPRDFTDEYNNTILHTLAAYGHLDTLLEIKEKYALPLTQNLYGATPLHHLMLSGEYIQIKRTVYAHLLDLDAIVTWFSDGFAQGQDKFGLPYAFYVAKSGNFDCLKKLIAKKFIDPFMETASGTTLWHALALSGKADALIKAKRYLRRNFFRDLNAITDKNGKNVWLALAESRNVKAAYKFADDGEFKLEDLSFIQAAVWGGNIDDIREKHQSGLIDMQYMLLDRWHGGIALDAWLACDEIVNAEDLTPYEYWQTKINEFYEVPHAGANTLSFFYILGNLLSKTPGFVTVQPQQNESTKGEVERDPFALFNNVLYCNFPNLFGYISPGYIPYELLTIIFKYLPFNDRLTLRRSCQYFNGLITYDKYLMIRYPSDPVCSYLNKIESYQKISIAIQEDTTHVLTNTLSEYVCLEDLALVVRNFPGFGLSPKYKDDKSYLWLLCKKHSRRTEIMRLIIQEKVMHQLMGKFYAIPYLTNEELELFIENRGILSLIGIVLGTNIHDPNFSIISLYPHFPWIAKTFAALQKRSSLSCYDVDLEKLQQFFIKVVEDDPLALIIIFEKYFDYLVYQNRVIFDQILKVIPTTALPILKQKATDQIYKLHLVNQRLTEKQVAIKGVTICVDMLDVRLTVLADRRLDETVERKKRQATLSTRLQAQSNTYSNDAIQTATQQSFDDIQKLQDSIKGYYAKLLKYRGFFTNNEPKYIRQSLDDPQPPRP